MNRPYNQHRNQGNRNNYDEVAFKEIFKPEWITKGADKEMVEFCKGLGKFLKNNKVSSSQLRNIYGEVMRIKLKGIENEKESFWLLKPKLAYNAGRIEKNNEKKAFQELLNKALYPAMEAVDVEDEKTFDNFQKFFEAILAYHKYYGGK
jgi:CRISPR-associated protein Csm2